MARKISLLGLAVGLSACAAYSGPQQGAQTHPSPNGVVAIGAEDANAPDGAIRATPMPSAPLDLSTWPRRIIFASCLDENGDQSIWSRIAAEKPDLVLFIGDNVYGDVRSDDPALPELKTAYMRLAQSAPFAAVREAAPVLTVWDDHDYGLNDAGADFRHRDASEALFDYVWAVPTEDPRRSYPGVYGSWYFEGPGGAPGDRLQIIALDTRYFRSALTKTDDFGAPGKERYIPDRDPGKTMLGDVQWAWLEAELRKPARKRILVSSIQVLADGHGWEAWRTLPAERDRLYATIREAAIDEIVILSGDRHAAAFYRTNVNGLEVYEVTSSSLNLPAARWREESGETSVEAGPNRLGGMIYDANYGVVETDPASGALSITLRGPDGKPYAP